MTIPQLVMVDAICKEGTVTAAAHRLAVTQPALSHRLRELESQLDLKLFRRDGMRMTVTREGERVARSARAVVEELARLKYDLGQLRSGYQGVLRIATECYTCYDWLPEALERFAAAFPGVEVQILPEATRDPVKPLLDGTLDLAMVYTPPDREDLALKPLFRDELGAGQARRGARSRSSSGRRRGQRRATLDAQASRRCESELMIVPGGSPSPAVVGHSINASRGPRPMPPGVADPHGCAGAIRREASVTVREGTLLASQNPGKREDADSGRRDQASHQTPGG